VVHLTLAIGDFLLILLGAAFWIGGGIVAAGVAGLGAVGAVICLVRKRRRLR